MTEQQQQRRVNENQQWITASKIKNTLEETNGRVTEEEEWISELEDKMVEITEAEQNKEKRMKRNEDRLRDLWDNIKCPNIWIIGMPEEEDKRKGHEKIFEEIIVENFSKMGKEIATKSRKPRESHTGQTQEETLQDTY